MPPAKPAPRRCAIYTRKSSEEGLEQDFNSLHAQREACEAFIKSQHGEGWRLVQTAYDDGGLSGGTMERPALQRLLADISAGRIDIVVVYKVDRLTRSLADFAKMVEVFDARGVSFVAVTQQFNTTSSMGRLTLNILLSFAQFEREVTGERIRDKIAASKRKGMWMGGWAPLGYDAHERKLVINPAEAETVRLIYQRYLELGCVRRLKEELDQRRVLSKRRMAKNGNATGGGSYSRGALYAILASPTYVGEIRHKGVNHPGQHEPIIDRALWDAVQQRLRENTAERRASPGSVEPSLLVGKLFDEGGKRLTPSHAVKDGRRYRYYVSQRLVDGSDGPERGGWRLPAREIEQTIALAARNMLDDQNAVAGALQDADIAAHQLPRLLAAASTLGAALASEQNRTSAFAAVVDRATLDPDGIRLTVSLRPLTNDAVSPASKDATITRHIPVRIKRRGVEMKVSVG